MTHFLPGSLAHVQEGGIFTECGDHSIFISENTIILIISTKYENMFYLNSLLTLCPEGIVEISNKYLAVVK